MNSNNAQYESMFSFDGLESRGKIFIYIRFEMNA